MSTQDDIATFRPSLVRYAHTLTRNGADAQDLTQDTLLRALRHQDQFEEGTDLGSWLRTIMYRVNCDNIRFASRRPPVGLLNEYDTPAVDDPAIGIVVGEVAAAIRKLPASGRMVVLHAQGYNYDEISQRTGVLANTVRSRVSRGHDKLRHLHPGL
jgi:RNA polymerase sigma-70 factor, ECF subfamily